MEVPDPRQVYNRAKQTSAYSNENSVLFSQAAVFRIIPLLFHSYNSVFSDSLAIFFL